MEHIIKDGQPIGHICDCGKRHEWPGYVFAHMNVELENTCKCGRKAILLHGRVIKIKEVVNND
jgi:hypothetical protein